MTNVKKLISCIALGGALLAGATSAQAEKLRLGHVLMGSKVSEHHL